MEFAENLISENLVPALRNTCIQARSPGGGVGGSYDPPPQLPIPKILFHPLAILFHPLAILFHLSAILFHPSAILFHPWNMWMTSRGQCPRGGGACECPRVGAFFKLMTSRGQCPRGGGAPGVPPIQVQTPPPGWLATGLCIRSTPYDRNTICRAYRI